ncbi:serine/threonine protein kinase [Candidatus Uabimicrobium sp. HlEnr_7]|uniref:serine/threonine protein kinase n=1 Tax=Candidatus Uabimicrobium helgolandensis TaxID=3095367 RepID=UPI00355847C5
MPYGQDPYQEKRSHEVGGRYKILQKIGKGGMGTVYRVHDKLLSRDIALKVLSDDQFGKEEHLRFKREAATIAKLRHENIIRLYDCGEYNGYPYFTMDLIQGVNLFEMSKKKKRGLPAKYMAEIMVKVADAIHYANEQGIIHRDLKPDNIMINEVGKPIVMDFGLAKVQHAETKLTCDGTMLGTLIYIAPEYVSGKVKEVDAQNDVYAIGVILYEMLTGYNPFHGRSHTDTMDKILFTKVPKPTKKNARIPKSLENICLKAIERNKKNRYQDAYRLKRDLEAFLSGKKIVHKGSFPSFSDLFHNPKVVMTLLVVTILIIIALTLTLLLFYAR